MSARNSLLAKVRVCGACADRTLLVGACAQAVATGTVKMTVRATACRDHLPAVFSLSHAKRTRPLANNPWFDAEVLSALRDAVRRALA